MAFNSIRKNLDKNTTISSIKLLLSSDFERRKSVVVVEGEDDWRFLRKFKSENTTIYESYSGKNGVNEIVENQYIKCNRVIGIRDRDYCKSLDCERIFFYDCCCLEMMLLSNDQTHYNVCFDLYDGPDDAADLRSNILLDLKPLSLMRKYNEEKNLGVNFKVSSINRYIKNFTFDFANYLNELKRSQVDVDWNEIELYINSEVDYYKSVDKLFEISNGHDYIEYFQEICNHYKGRGINKHNISSLYRSCFSEDAFKSTTLYNELTDYFYNKLLPYLF